MEGRQPLTGLRRLCLGAVAALWVAGSGVVDAENNPWDGTLDKFNIPMVHGSGVYVDLGNSKRLNGKAYREPSGKCPVMGKVIELLQPTKDAAIWPRDYLARVPVEGSPQDTMPLGGGFGMWETEPVNISPLTLEELKQFAEKAKKNPSSAAAQKLSQVVDDHGLCAWWAWSTSAKSKTTTPLESRYRYPFVWDEDKKMCTLLAVAMQKLDGSGKYCTQGDDKTQLTWYCFQPQKAGDNVSYNSAYIRPDHATACPERPVKGAHFGVWNGITCARIIPRSRDKVKNAADCGKLAFLKSASDNPTKYTSVPDQSGLQQDDKDSVATLWPAGAFGADQPHSRGVGINYANWYTDGICEVYDAVPTCFTYAPGGYSFTALGKTDPLTAELPPCIKASEGWQIWGFCECGNTKQPWVCKDGEWIGGDDSCDCSGNTLALAIGLGVGIPLCLIGGFVLYKLLRRRPVEDPEKKQLIQHEEQTQSSFYQVKQREKHKQSDLRQEAEPSFWGETDQEATNVTVGEEEGPTEAYY